MKPCIVVQFSTRRQILFYWSQAPAVVSEQAHYVNSQRMGRSPSREPPNFSHDYFFGTFSYMWLNRFWATKPDCNVHGREEFLFAHTK
jgi:hypothetical protein